MFRTILAAAAATLSIAAEASTPTVYLKGDSAHVAYRDLDLHSVDGRQRLESRIKEAAQLLCAAPYSDPLLPFPSEAQCYRVAMADGLAQMNVITRRQ